MQSSIPSKLEERHGVRGRGSEKERERGRERERYGIINRYGEKGKYEIKRPEKRNEAGMQKEEDGKEK